MPISDARRRANEKWQKEKTDEIKVRVPKGQKERLRAQATKKGESLNGLFQRLINQELEEE
ncbi:hypothetical protein RFF05_09955 [Bengtsoniella intestinalis]|uniref:hypothetical protein n=1 Tax=Bengtsoniella intestinalis TaxID=3073143 RepID=UPI00391F96C0